MADLRIKRADGSFAEPSAVRILQGGRWQDAADVRVVGHEDQPSSQDSESYVFVDGDTLDTQKQRVNNGEEQFVTAYNTLVDDANTALSVGLKSVTDDGGGHEFTADTNGRHDYMAAIDMSGSARDCGLAYWFTGDDDYAKKVVDIVHHWCLGDSTYMTPTTDVANNAATIEQHITIPAFMYAASFVRDHPRWDAYDGTRPWDGGTSADAEAAFARWVEDRYDTFPDSQPGYCEYNNKWAWRIVDRAASGAYLQNDAYVAKAKTMWQARDEITCPDGSTRLRPWHDYKNQRRDGRAYDGSADPANDALFQHELNRSNGFHYSQYNLKALAIGLLVFEAYDGTTLWGFNAPQDDYSGSSLRKAFNWMAPYVRDTAAWRWDDAGIPSSDVEAAASVFELAHRHWGRYNGVLDDPDGVGGRPHHERRLLGPVTLTHGSP